MEIERRERAPDVSCFVSDNQSLALVSREEFESSDKRRQKMETREETPCHSSWQSKIQRRWRRGEEEEPEKTEVGFQIQNERKHKSKEEEDENDRVAVGEELSKNACAAGGMASEEVGEEDYFQSSSKVRNFKVMALQSDNITINRVESLLKRHQTFY
ncbi:hypothetical protein Bca52824_038850 [Brassica carinata]|uniref:Uncharacterized protein n=1 Tax=Brassica carinata TaxID=52824 RepID=A0A8X7RPV8_BRACI|nr:hypothetical protein Bca52824_038850 [Brassica carinata]